MNTLYIKLYDINNNLIENKYVKDFEINEDYIIKQSSSRFFTDEPCIIYRTCIINLALINLEEYLRSQIKKNNLYIRVLDLPENIIEMINIYKNVYVLHIT
jgi:hypothetical protein